MKNSILLVLISLMAFADQAKSEVDGPSTGGGGFVVSCPANPLEPQGLNQLLDLYKSQSMGFELAESAGTIEADYFNSVDRTYTLQGHPNLAEELKADINKNLRNFFRITKLVNSVNELPKVADYGNLPWIPTSCNLQQVAYFDDTKEQVIILQPLWNKLSKLDQAALVSHELFYRNERLANKRKNSEIASHLVALIFSKEGSVAGALDGLDSQAKPIFFKNQTPAGVGTVGYRAKDINNHDVLQVSHIAGIPVLAKMQLRVDIAEINLKPAKSSTGASICVLDKVGYERELELYSTGDVAIPAALKLILSLKHDQPVRLKMLDTDGKVLSEDTLDLGFNCKL